jgi:anhydro-N-acetylmuramic acid kinase
VIEGLFLGAISGTSVDGLDLALIRAAGPSVAVLQGHTYPLPAILRQQLLNLGQPGAIDLDALGTADTALGQFIGETTLTFLAEAGLRAAEITAIGSHGQTVRHRPVGPEPFTLQIGDPNRIAEVTGITVVADFRRRDLAAGGQGAPLVPPFHRRLFGNPVERRAVLNLGGIGNLTFLPSDPAEPVTGFDTGPGNGLMDAWIATCKGLPFDADGAWSRSGMVHPQLLQRLLDDPYLQKAPPKSTGREYFNLPWLHQQLRFAPADPADVQATLRALTAATVSLAIARWGPATQRVIVCGGGRLNRALLDDLRDRLSQPVDTAEMHGVDGDSLEAAAFGWLASLTLSGQAGNAPSVTGARGLRLLGGVYRP